MKRSRLSDTKFLTLVAALLASSIVASCGKPGDRYGSSTYRIPWPSATGAMSLQNVEIPTLSDPEHFSGSSAQILVEPGDGGGTLAAARPVGRYVKTSSGVLVPVDYVTIQAVTAYAHQERLREVDTSVGVVDVLSWPLSIGIDVHLMSFDQVSTNNAVYDAKLNSLLLVPYDEGDLPISLNPGILAHEHFHFIFQKIVMSRVHDSSSQTSCAGGVAVGAVDRADSRADNRADNQKATSPAKDERADNETQLEKTAAGMPAKTYNAFVLRAMNEGFADFYGWLYAHDDSFLAKSLPDQDEMRRLDRVAGRLPPESLVRRLLVDNFHPDKILPEVVRSHNAYVLGTVYARFLRHLAAQLEVGGLSPSDARLMVARALMASLPAIADLVTSTYENGYLSPNAVLKPLLANLPALSKDGCASLTQFRAPEASFVMPAACAAATTTSTTATAAPATTVEVTK